MLFIYQQSSLIIILLLLLVSVQLIYRFIIHSSLLLICSILFNFSRTHTHTLHTNKSVPMLLMCTNIYMLYLGITTTAEKQEQTPTHIQWDVGHLCMVIIMIMMMMEGQWNRAVKQGLGLVMDLFFWPHFWML